MTTTVDNKAPYETIVRFRKWLVDDLHYDALDAYQLTISGWPNDIAEESQLRALFERTT